MASMGSSGISVPSAWRDANPTQPSSSTLLDALERAATAARSGVEPRWPCIGRYRVRGKLGQGGMSSVWEALDDQLDRRVAIKLLRRDLSHGHGQRLRREAQALAKLSHPNVVQVYEVIEAEGLTAVVMELVEGQTLRRWQEQQPRPGWKACVELYLQAGRGLAAAHAVGLVHRDFKPDNCIVDEEGRVRVLDFGLVAREHDETTVDEVESGSAGDSLELRLTRTGTLMGTAAYMPPERLGRRGGDGMAGDQFSFCASIYEALHGERPFAGGSEKELQAAIESGRARPPPKGSRVPSRVRAVVLRGLAVDPGQRWESMPRFLAELERVLARSGRWRWLGVGMGTALVGAAVSGAVLTGMTRQTCAGAADQLGGVWDEERRAAVRAAILDTRTQHATDTWIRIEPMLNDYASQWASKHTEICEATRVTAVQTEEDMGLRMRCLDKRRIALLEAVAVLARGGADTRANAVSLVSRLPAITFCDDLEALHAQLPPPRDPELARAVDEARARLSRARTQREAGTYADAEREASEVLDEAERLGYEPLMAEALLERGECRAALARRAEAEEDLEGALDLAQRIDYRNIEARAASGLGRLAAGDRSRLDEAERLARHAWNLANRRGSDRLLLADAASAYGDVRTMRSTVPIEQRRTLDLQRSARALYVDALGSEHPAVAKTHESEGDLLKKQKKPWLAQESYEQALHIYENALGSSHPAVAEVSSKLGVALVEQGDPDMALELHEHALSMREAVFGPWHPSIAFTWTRIGIALHRQGRLEEAWAAHRHALEILGHTPGQEPTAEIGIVCELGFVLRDQGRMMEAVDWYDFSVLLRDEAFGPLDPYTVLVVMNIGDELLDRGLFDAAEDRYLRSLDRSARARCYCAALALIRLGEVALARRDIAGAAQYVKRAMLVEGFADNTSSNAAMTVQARFRRALRRAGLDDTSLGEGYEGYAEAVRLLEDAAGLAH
ncbi:protein kinase domain-containing protein [Paraliomyxa miuraensis]|uniref:protein kinase domain-containing protein n=1 Tax=Paraliomyxa miuraensis TaxID=376150 RepID=UPI002252ECA0|nr:tetratricopeptide repeat protein [Paraliomyxa miuraensis]MCX4239335.1 tetratricopeptide repeat protein [Paraliomyxa miuraensis]